jgi:Ca-activated chloride channel family protein
MHQITFSTYWRLLPATLVLFLALSFAPTHAQATGMVAEYLQYEPTLPYSPDLLRLESLTVDVQMSEAGAQIVEKRTYGWEKWNMYTNQATVRFFRTMPAQHGAQVVKVLINDSLVTGQQHDNEAADHLRRTLVTQLGQPGPARGAGRSLFATDPITLVVDGGDKITVTITVDQPLSPRGSMKGLSIPVDWHKLPIPSMSVQVTAMTDTRLRNLYSPYHDLSLKRLNDREMVGAFTGNNRCTTFDITLLLSTGSEPFHVDLLPYRYDAKEGGHFMAMIAPDAQVADQNVAPRDVVLVIDRSGSMNGEKMNQAKAALSSVLGGLRPDDSFAIVAFDGDIETFTDEAIVASDSNVNDGQAFVENLQADGATNLYSALLTGFQALPIQKGHPRYIVLMTDGQPTAGITDTEEILAMARAQNEVGARIFAFGIGYNVNTILLDKLAKESAGDALYIQPGQSVDSALEAFFAQIVDPVLTNPSLDVSAFDGELLVPDVMNDLYAGNSTIVLGRYHTPGKGQLILRGSQKGNPVEHVFDVTLPAYAVTEGYVPRIWATRHVGSLLGEVKLGNKDPTLVEEALRLAKRYGVVTEFTYFQVDKNGNTDIAYSAVPVSASGAVAVQTSSSLDSYQKGGTVGASIDTFVRYAWDRTLPIQQEWFTDTRLDDPNEWTDVHFGSDQYFNLLMAESHLGIDAFLGLAKNVRFELLGRFFRVTDPLAQSRSETPTESEFIPEADPILSSQHTSVAVASDPTNDNPVPPVTNPSDPTTKTVIVLQHPHSTSGCAANPHAPTRGVAGLLLLGLFLIGFGQSIRRVTRTS